MKFLYKKNFLLYPINLLGFFLISIFLIPSLKASNPYKNKLNLDYQKNEPLKSQLNGKSKDSIKIEINNLKGILEENNKSIKSLKSKVKQTEANYKSKLALWSPKFYLNSNDAPKYITGDSFDNISDNTSTNKLSLGINANVEWDIIKPNRRLEIKISEEEISNAEYLLNSKINDLYLEALKLFYQIQATYQEIALAQKSIEVSELSLLEAQEKYKAGIGNKIEVLEAQTQLERDQIKKVKKIGQLNKNKNSLYLLLDSDNTYKVEEDKNFTLDYVWSTNFEESTSQAYKNRADLKIKKKDISINNKKAISVKSEKQPEFTLYNQFSLNKSWGENDVSTKPDFNKQNKGNSNNLGIKFKWNLLDGGQIKQRYISLSNRTNELKQEYNLSKNQIKSKIADSFINLDISMGSIVYSFNQLNAAKETLEISLKRLEAGLTTQREIVNIQADLSESESNYINSILDYKITLAELERATLLEKQSICNLISNKKENMENNFYLFIVNNNLNKKCDPNS